MESQDYQIRLHANDLIMASIRYIIGSETMINNIIRAYNINTEKQLKEYDENIIEFYSRNSDPQPLKESQRRRKLITSFLKHRKLYYKRFPNTYYPTLRDIYYGM